MAAESAGDLPEALPQGSTGSGSSLTSTNPTGVSNNNDNQTKESPPRAAAVVGAVVGGLAFLAMIGIGVWAFLRIRKASGKVGMNHPDHSRESVGVVVSDSEYSMQPSQMQPHVSFLTSYLFYFLTRTDRTRRIHLPPPAKVSTERTGRARAHPAGFILPVPRKCEQSRGHLVAPTSRSTSGLAIYIFYLLFHTRQGGIHVILLIVAMSCGFGFRS